MFQVEPKPIKDIDFKKPKKRKLPTIEDENENTPLPVNDNVARSTDPWGFLLKVHQIQPKAAIFSITHPKTTFVLKTDILPIDFNSFNYHLSIDEAMAKATKILQPKEIDNLEKYTRNDEQKWMQYRLGRLTSSLFGDVLGTNIEKPSKSLIKKILQTNQNVFHKNLEYGKRNEPHALNQYSKYLQQSHIGVTLMQPGLLLHPQSPFLGSTPDAIIHCKCHGKFIAEIKCPISKAEVHPCSDDHDSSFYIKSHTPVDNKVECPSTLNKTHKYYHQVQGEIDICDVSFGHFVVWTPKGLHVEKIERDPSFQLKVKPKLELFFRQVILPELIQEQYCSCGQPEEYDDMVQCDGLSCQVKWYHMKCVGLVKDAIPDGEWFCPSCKKQN